MYRYSFMRVKRFTKHGRDLYSLARAQTTTGTISESEAVAGSAATKHTLIQQREHIRSSMLNIVPLLPAVDIAINRAPSVY